METEANRPVRMITDGAVRDSPHRKRTTELVRAGSRLQIQAAGSVRRSADATQMETEANQPVRMITAGPVRNSPHAKRTTDADAVEGQRNRKAPEEADISDADRDNDEVDNSEQVSLDVDII